ncbi:hypothetical protein OQA88_2402, partial [Cercophora sp. LCS_1]
MARRRRNPLTGGKRSRAAPIPQGAANGRAGRVSRQYRRKAGTVALREIRNLQSSTEPLIPFAPFVRLVREIALGVSDDRQYFRFQKASIEALREAAESFLTALFTAGNLLAIHGKRVTLMKKDLWLVKDVMSVMAPHAEFYLTRCHGANPGHYSGVFQLQGNNVQGNNELAESQGTTSTSNEQPAPQAQTSAVVNSSGVDPDEPIVPSNKQPAPQAPPQAQSEPEEPAELEGKRPFAAKAPRKRPWASKAPKKGPMQAPPGS